MTFECCPCCGEAVRPEFCVEGGERILRCANQHVVKRERIDRGPVPHDRLQSWMRRLEVCSVDASAPRY